MIWPKSNKPYIHPHRCKCCSRLLIYELVRGEKVEVLDCKCVLTVTEVSYLGREEKLMKRTSCQFHKKVVNNG